MLGDCRQVDHMVTRTSQKVVPYYQQVANVLRTRILSSQAESPVRLPTEYDLCQTHQVSRITVRKALDVLQGEGLIHRTPGRGTVTVPSGVRVWRRLRQSHMIKLVTSFAQQIDVPMSFYGQIHQGIFARGEQAGYSLATTQLHSAFPVVGPEEQPEDPEQVVGVIITGVPDERVISMHGKAGYPVVCVDYWTTHPTVDVVVLDCFGEGQMAVEYLLSQGHRDLFFLGNCHGEAGGRQHEADAELMLAGYRRAANRAGLSLSDDRVRFVRRAVEAEAQGAAEWFLSLQPRPTAGVVFSSETIFPFRDCLASHGLACPEDVSLICKAYVGEPVEVAALRGDAFAMGQLAIDLLLERAAGKRQTTIRVALPSTLSPGPTVKRRDN